MMVDSKTTITAPVTATGPRIRDAVDRGWDFLSASADAFPSASVAFDAEISDPITVEDIPHRARTELGVDLGFAPADEGFTAMLALDNLPQPLPARALALLPGLMRRVESCRWNNRYRFFPDVPQFAADTDCTALAALGLSRHHFVRRSRLQAVAQELLRAGAPASSASEGLRPGAVMVYWEDGAEASAKPRGRKHDPLVSANVLRALHLADRHPDCDGPGVAGATFRHAEDHLLFGDYLEGTRYYPSPVAFLHAAAKLSAACRDCEDRLGPALRKACVNLSAPTNALDLALFLIAAGACDAPVDRDAHRAELIDLQRPDGSWPAHSYFRFGRVPIHFGSAHLTTVFALRALDEPTGV
jgi:hypothetical protein